ncbi:MAG: carboxylating nicotinate-nucleotide diphosphorylase [Candidatus Atribacteria bacterium]|nr:carboxylating nicotinate-nucleotide diphosphorylase [Candidatus Atribacteria bacterium]
MEGWPIWIVDQYIEKFLQEDVGVGDLTTQGIGKFVEQTIRADIVAKQEGVMAGGQFALRVFTFLDREVKGEIVVQDGAFFRPREVLMRLSGNAAAILTGERTALNLLQRLSGIATRTREMVNLVEDLGVKIADTRKTTPGLRAFEKYAVRCGGGINHRLGLYDCVLIKDNHIMLCGSLQKAIREVRSRIPFTAKIVVECANVSQVREALEERVDVIMLDNMGLEDIKQAVRMAKGRAIIEASGNVGPHNVRLIAEQGVDIISSGYITHHASWIDMSLEIEDQNGL